MVARRLIQEARVMMNSDWDSAQVYKLDGLTSGSVWWSDVLWPMSSKLFLCMFAVFAVVATAPRARKTGHPLAATLDTLREGPPKFIYELDSGRSKLFDVEQDPQEKMDVSNRYAEEARRYMRNLRSWSAAQKHLLGATR
jgi:hypothetical protein